ncbi:MAG: isochorismatase family cysteine hydrolase [Candidatus Korobacteraceae bacterium]|jgi:ureidoacrylate peracid hydrolase
MGRITLLATLFSLCTLSLMTVAAAAAQPAVQPNQAPKGMLKTLEEQIDPQITALLVIDMQNDYVADNGKLGKAGFDVKRIQAAVPAMNNLIMEARKAGVMVVWIRQTHTFKDSLPNYVASNVARVKDRPFAETDFLVQGGSWGAEYYEKMTKRLDGELEVIKHTYGAFTNTPLDTYLRARGIKTILSIGTVTNVCVQSTAMQGWFLGYYSIIPADAVSTNDLSLHQATLKNHSIFFGYTPKNDDIIAIWKKYAASR